MVTSDTMHELSDSDEPPSDNDDVRLFFGCPQGESLSLRVSCMDSFQPANTLALPTPSPSRALALTLLMQPRQSFRKRMWGLTVSWC